MLVANGSDGEDPLAFDEMVGFATTLLLAGAKTASNMLSNWVAAVMDRPDLEAQLTADSSLVYPSIEELFRYDSWLASR
jgi:cytochrome P450